jgi:hypothetical protein
MTTITLGDSILDDLLGVSASPVTKWPPSSFVPPAWDHPITAWTWELLAHGKQLPYEIPHFPDHLDIHDIAYRGVDHRVLLVGLKMTSERERPPMIGMPLTSDGTTWGGVVEIDGRDLLTHSAVYANGDEGRGAAVVSYAKTSGGLLVTFVAAVTVTEGMTVKRHTIDRYGKRVPGSLEEWVVQNGEVRRAG